MLATLLLAKLSMWASAAASRPVSVTSSTCELDAARVGLTMSGRPRSRAVAIAESMSLTG